MVIGIAWLVDSYVAAQFPILWIPKVDHVLSCRSSKPSELAKPVKKVSDLYSRGTRLESQPEHNYSE
jgi:hypothetical protein